SVVLYTLVGDEVQRHLTGLRPKQAKEYAEAFKAALAGGGPRSPAAAAATAPAPVHSARSAAAAPPSNQYGRQQVTHSPPRDSRGMGANQVHSPERVRSRVRSVFFFAEERF